MIRIDHSYCVIESSSEYKAFEDMGFNLTEVSERGGYTCSFLSFEDRSYLEFLHLISDEVKESWQKVLKERGLTDYSMGLSFKPTADSSLDLIDADFKKRFDTETSRDTNEKLKGLKFLTLGDHIGKGVFSWFTEYPKSNRAPQKHPNSVYMVSRYVVGGELSSEYGRFVKEHLPNDTFIFSEKYAQDKQNFIKAVVLRAKSMDSLAPYLGDKNKVEINKEKFFLLRKGKTFQYDLLVEIDS